LSHSMGGYLAARYAMRYPQHIDALLLLSPAGVPAAPDGQLGSRPGIFFRVLKCLWGWRATPTAVLRALGPLGPRIYQVAAAYPGEAFEDVTEGNSRTSCSTGFPAAKGWDPTTGWGRPIWPGLLKHFGDDKVL